MTATALERLERIAARVGWRLRWKAERDRVHPRFTWSELDIFEGSRLVTADSAVWLYHSDSDELGLARAREKIARMVLAALPRRGAAAS